MADVIFVELLGRRGRAIERTRIGAFPVTIGRALTNEVVIDDIYVSPRHARLVHDSEGQLFVEDTGSTNGIYRAHSRERVARLTIHSGDVVRIGHSLLRFRSPDGHVADAIVDDFEHGRLRRVLAAPPIAILMGLLAIGALALDKWLESFERVQPERLAADSSYTLLFIAAWAGLWSLASRFGSRGFDFVSHFSFACGIGVLSVATGVATQYYEFFASPLRSMPFVEFGAEAIVLCLLLFGHLSIATRLQRLRRIALAIVVVVPLAGLTELEDTLYDAEFDTTLHYPSQLKPVPPSWIPSRTVSEFLAGTHELEGAVDALIEDGEDG